MQLAHLLQQQPQQQQRRLVQAPVAHQHRLWRQFEVWLSGGNTTH
jgi:hypothetical protein